MNPIPFKKRINDYRHAYQLLIEAVRITKQDGYDAYLKSANSCCGLCNMFFKINSKNEFKELIYDHLTELYPELKPYQKNYKRNEHWFPMYEMKPRLKIIKEILIMLEETNPINGELYPELMVTYTRNRNIEFTANRSISKERAIEEQIALGYNPAGYSFYDYKVVKGETSWKCFGSCD